MISAAAKHVLRLDLPRASAALAPLRPSAAADLSALRGKAAAAASSILARAGLK
ncbi:hypothetical protein [Microcystis phage vB_MweS-yong2]|nr:hypothetical protein [Microcystis phage vB_MweS-yong2]